MSELVEKIVPGLENAGGHLFLLEKGQGELRVVPNAHTDLMNNHTRKLIHLQLKTLRHSTTLTFSDSNNQHIS